MKISSTASAGLLLAATGVVVVLAVDLVTGWPDLLAVTAALFATPGLAVAVVATVRDDTPTWVGHVALSVATVGGLATLTALTATVILVGPVDDGQGHLAAAIVAALLTGLVAEPVRRGVTRWTRGADDQVTPLDVVARADDALGRNTPVDEVLLRSAEGLRAAHDADAVEIWTGDPERLVLRCGLPLRPTAPLVLDTPTAALIAAAPVSGREWASIQLPDLLDGSFGDDGNAILVAPLSVVGSLCGLIVVLRRAPFNESDRLALEELGRRLAPAIDNEKLGSQLRETVIELRRQATELQASRSRLVSAGDEARRQIERDLHDGVQQQLIALSLNLGLVERMVADGRTDEATALLGDLGAETTEMASALRSLAHGIFPPLLRERGLAKALAALAERDPGLAVTGDCGRLAEPTEAAVYFCCTEAVANARKHAPGSPVQIQLSAGEHHLRFEISDRGPGFDRRVIPEGHGLTNMRDRLGSIGGRLTVESGPDGTTIGGTAPLTR